MTTKTIYTCDFCKTDYESETDCQMCEQKHAQASYINYGYVANEQYPTSITILYGETPIKYLREEHV